MSKITDFSRPPEEASSTPESKLRNLLEKLGNLHKDDTDTTGRTYTLPEMEERLERIEKRGKQLIEDNKLTELSNKFQEAVTKAAQNLHDLGCTRGNQKWAESFAKKRRLYEA